MKQTRDRRRRQRIRKRFYRLGILLCVVMFVFSAVSLIRYCFGSARTSRTNAQLSALYNAGEETDSTDVETDMSGADSNEQEIEAFGMAETEYGADESETPQSTVSAAPTERPKTYQYVGDSIADSAKELYSINPDYVAWINIPGVVDLPVVYRDNEYYLTRDFYGKESSSGTLFLDQYHPFSAQTQYMLIHGHAMYDGSMFGFITHYRGTDYVIKHPYLTLNTLYSKETYEVFASCLLSEYEMLTTAKMCSSGFASDEDFNEFIDNIRACALNYTSKEIPSDSAILALSTCFKDQRLVVFFRRIASEPLV